MRNGASSIPRRASAVALVLLVAVGTAACARDSASRSAPEADPPAWVKDAAVAQASAARDANPTLIEWVKGAFIQIMPLTWHSFLLPTWTGTLGSRSDWFHIGPAVRHAIQDLSA
jgi:hypothetical protein